MTKTEKETSSFMQAKLSNLVNRISRGMSRPVSKFIRDMLNRTRDSLLAKLDSVPESWDGHELRAWITIDVARNIGGVGLVPVTAELRDLRKPRVKEFRRAVVVNNL